MFILLLLITTVASHSLRNPQPCCVTCTKPQEKYFSVDHGWGHPPFCGETCLNPNKYDILHIFEHNLTLADNQTHPCAFQYAPDGRKYSHYNKTVTHGIGSLSVTLDLYNPE